MWYHKQAMAYHQFQPVDGSEPFGSFEVFHYDLASFQHCKGADGLVGFYWQSCFPGCIPDSDAIGPFSTEAEAIQDANS